MSKRIALVPLAILLFMPILALALQPPAAVHAR